MNIKLSPQPLTKLANRQTTNRLANRNGLSGMGKSANNWVVINQTELLREGAKEDCVVCSDVV